MRFLGSALSSIISCLVFHFISVRVGLAPEISAQDVDKNKNWKLLDVESTKWKDVMLDKIKYFTFTCAPNAYD